MKHFIRIFVIIVILVLTGLGCKEVTPPKKVTLNWWRVFDDSDAVAQIVQDYQTLHPNVSINYRKLRPEEYEEELINALAEDRGPDIFAIHNTAMGKYQPKLLPLPRELTITYQYVKGGLKKETVVETRKEKTIRLDQLRDQFVDQVAYDVILPYRTETGEVTDRIFGLPLALDTMVLYWNRDLLNVARIPEPARTWEEFLQHVTLMTKYDPQSNIIQAGAALGTAGNVERGHDLLSVLMMQNGTQMMRDRSVTFNQVPAGEERGTLPGLEALRFYTDFANPSKEAYTWNSDLPNSLDAFTSGTAAYFFGYAYHLPTIRARAPKLNFSLAPIPQIDPANEVNFANYWIEGVSSKTKNPDYAWDFVQFATKADHATSYLEKTKKPTALRSLISTQLDDVDLSVFASSVLTAKSWYQGKDPAAAERAFSDMIENVVSGMMEAGEAINIAAGQVSQTMQ